MHNQHHRTAFPLAGIFLLAAVLAHSAEYPSWWTTRSVIEPTATVHDFAAVNQGQVKWIALKACEELEANLRGGAGEVLTTLVGSFALNRNYSAVNLGQLKRLAKPFYDRLILAGYTNSHPWTAATTDDVNNAAANIGQVKNLFSFDLKDTDSDGMPDWWELANGLDPNLADGQADTDDDGISNALEYRRWTNPQNSLSANLTFYVNANVTVGNDSYDGLSRTWDGLHGPKRTIGAAITVTLSKDMIEVAEGEYLNEPLAYHPEEKTLKIRPIGRVVVRR